MRGAAALVLALGACESSTQSAGPNTIVLVVLDATRADHLAPWGGAPETTPSLTQLAETARVYRTAYAAAPWTLPSHVTLFTGLDVHEHGTDHGALRYDRRAPLLAEALKQDGYATGAFSNNPWITEATGVGSGFDVFVEVFRRSMASGRSINRFVDVEATGLADAGGARTVAAVGQWLDELGSAPAFVFVNLIEAHLPYDPPGTTAARNGQVRAANDEWLRRAHAGVADQALIDNMGRLYDEELRYDDEQLGRLMALLDEHGRLDEALIVITSDHGEAFAEGRVGRVQLIDHQLSLRDELLRVPLLVRWPGHVAPGVATSPVGLKDVGPFVQWAAKGGGESDVPVLLTDGDPERVFVASYAPPSEHLPFLLRFVPDQVEARRLAARGLRAVRRGRYKLVAPSDGEPELFDLATDPGEMVDIALRDPQTVAALRALLPPATATNGAAPPSSSTDGLRALGYVEER